MYLLSCDNSSIFGIAYHQSVSDCMLVAAFVSLGRENFSVLVLRCSFRLGVSDPMFERFAAPIQVPLHDQFEKSTVGTA